MDSEILVLRLDCAGTRQFMGGTLFLLVESKERRCDAPFLLSLIQVFFVVLVLVCFWHEWYLLRSKISLSEGLLLVLLKDATSGLMSGAVTTVSCLFPLPSSGSRSCVKSGMLHAEST